MKMELTSTAEKFIRRMVRCSGNNDAGFKLKVRHGGCSGYAVEFDLAADPERRILFWRHSDLRLFLDSVSCLLLNESVVDFIDSRSLTGFVITTPARNARVCSPVSTMVPVDALIRR